MLVRTSDATWQAYNKYGGNSLYSCTSPCPPGNPGAYKGAFSVSYNRPFDGTITQDNGRSYLFYAEYQMIRFIERNGYDASYTSQADVARQRRAAAQPQGHHLQRARRVLVGAGARQHRGGARRRREPRLLQRQRGVLEDALAVEQRRRHGHAVPDAHHVQGHALRRGRPIRWSGQARGRDPRFSAPGDGGRPPNALTGQLFIVNSGASDITVPSTYKNLRLWRNTAVAEPRRRAVEDARARRPGARLRVGHRRRQRLPPARAVPALVDHGERRRVVHRLRHQRQAGHDADPPPHDVQGAERRARLRGRDGPVGVGPRRHQRLERQRAAAPARRRIPSCSRRRSTSSPTWARQATTLMSGLTRRLAVDRHDGARLDDHEPVGRARRSPTARR